MLSSGTSMLWGVSFILVAAGLGVAAGMDVKHRVIPDASALAVLAGGVMLRILSEPRTMWLSAGAGAALYVLLAALVHASIIGGGDAKFGTAVTFLVPAIEVPRLLFDISIAGGLLGLSYLLAKRMHLTREATLPFGVAISGGAAYRVLADLCLR